MLNYIDLVMFAIQAAIKLGRKIQTVFEDETRDRELILPAGGTQRSARFEHCGGILRRGGQSLCARTHPRRGGGRYASGPLPRSMGPTQ